MLWTSFLNFLKYQEDLAELKDASKYKPHVLLCQENTQIRDLQQENKGNAENSLWFSWNVNPYFQNLQSLIGLHAYFSDD